MPGSGQFSISMVVRTVDLSQFSQISFFPSVSVLVFLFFRGLLERALILAPPIGHALEVLLKSPLVKNTPRVFFPVSVSPKWS